MKLLMTLIFASLMLPLGPVSAAPDDPLAPVEFLVGTWNGEGKHPYGAYQETQTASRGVGGTVIEIRTKSTMGPQTVHEDLRVISFDPTAKALRMRQWAKGVLRVYTGKTGKAGQVVFSETSREGVSAEHWRYTFVPTEGGGFTYQVHIDKGSGWKPFVSGSLGAKLKDPGKGGGLGVRQYNAEVDGRQAEIHHPDGQGPYPVIVFSPGGNAGTVQGYRAYGRWFATWGYITVIVAFDDSSAETRAPKFKSALDWVVGENTRDGAPLRGMIDTKRLALAGHSRGGNAALRAARSDPRVRACLALAPSGPAQAIEGQGTCPVCLIIGAGDMFLGAAKMAYANAAGERFLLEVPGMTHMLDPREATLKLVKRSTAFLNYALKGDKRYRAPLVAEGGGLVIKQAGK